jgi:hypothetical protein
MPAVVEAFDPEKELPVDPGKEAVARFRVRNTGDDVNNFTFRILGEPGRWPTGVRIVGDPKGEKKTKEGPPELDLLPNEKGEVEVTFRPPETSETAAGLVPYSLLVCSYAMRDDRREEDVEVVEEGLLNVGKFHKRDARLLPRTSRGRFAGRHRLAIDNYGNTPAIATFSSEDAENQLEVRFSPRTLVVEPGTVAFTKVKVKPRRKFLLGPSRAAPFKLFVMFERDAVEGETVPPAAGETIPPVEGLYMQRAIVPPLLLPISALVIAGVILWAVFKPRVQSTAQELAPAQEQARTDALARRANALTLTAVRTAHSDAVQARKQAARAASLARKDAKQAASLTRKDAKQTQKQAATATAAAAQAGTKADRAARQADKALKTATPPFGGTPYGQQLALPSNCTSTCTSPQPFTAQPFPAHTFYVTDLLLGNPGNGQGTLTLTLGGKPVLVQALASLTGLDLKPSTPLLVQGDQSLALRVSCAKGPCAPSVYLSGFFPTKPPNPSGPDGTPNWKRLSLPCHTPSACAVLTIPANAGSYELTDVIFQNPAGDTGTVTLSRGKQPLLVEGLGSGNLPISLAAPIVLKAGEKLTLTVSCKNAGGRQCAPGALLNGVLKLPASPKKK